MSWREDCLREWGRELTGEFGHYCDEWDELPIDETCREFDVCTCDFVEVELEGQK